MPRPVSGRVRKHFRLDPARIAAAQAALGTTTETETIERALDLAAFQRDAIAGVERGAGARLWVDVFGDEPEE